jgi:hypothetical protein
VSNLFEDKISTNHSILNNLKGGTLMKKREMSLIDPLLVNAGQVGEIMSPIITEVLKLSPQQIQYWIGKKGKLQDEIHKILIGSKNTVSDELQSWIDLYREEFVIDLRVEELQIPEYRENTWIIPLQEFLTEDMIYNACKKHFSCVDDVDFSSVQDLLRLPGTTVRRFKAEIEADEENKNMSVHDLRTLDLERGAITLKERMLLELWYFRTTGGHLDVSNCTLCNASRSLKSGNAPRVRWDHNRLDVQWSHPDCRYGFLRSRIATS